DERGRCSADIEGHADIFAECLIKSVFDRTVERDFVSRAATLRACDVKYVAVNLCLDALHLRLDAKLRDIERGGVNRIAEGNHPRIERRAFVSATVIVTAFVICDAEQAVGAEGERLRRRGCARAFG